MSFDLDNPYLDIEVDDLVLGLYEVEGVRKITELSRQVRSLLNLKTDTIRYRFRSNSNISAKLKDVKFYENKKQFESLALRFIKLLNKIVGTSRRDLEEEIQILFYHVAIKRNQISRYLLKELEELTFQLFMKIHYFSEQDLYDHPLFLKTLLQIAIEACKTRKNLNHAFSEFYAELGENYRNLEEEFISIVPEKRINKVKRKIKQLSEELIS
jgi:hypothetical protein